MLKHSARRRRQGRIILLDSDSSIGKNVASASKELGHPNSRA
jgi:hypothetical protein